MLFRMATMFFIWPQFILYGYEFFRKVDLDVEMLCANTNQKVNCNVKHDHREWIETQMKHKENKRNYNK